MKNLKITLCALFVLCCGFMFAACSGETTKDFNIENFEIKNAEVVYDGDSHIFEVEYEDVELNVTYSVDKVLYKSADQMEFVNAGTYDVYYKVSAEGYNTFTSTKAVQMKINKKTATLSVGDTVICKTDAVTTIDPDYTISGLVGDDTINASFSIGSLTATGAEYNAANASYGQKYNYNITVEDNNNYEVVMDEQNGHVVVKDYFEVITGSDVQYTTTLQQAFGLLGENDNSIIRLHKDISADTITDANKLVRIETKDAYDKNYTFTIDINGHKFEGGIGFDNWIGSTNYYDKSINATVTDTSKNKTGVIGSEDATYAIAVFGNNKVSVLLKDVTLIAKYGGLFYNGTCEGSQITAFDVNFEATNEGSASVYLAGKATYIFNNCKFEGGTGYYTKSGVHTLNNCTFIAKSTVYEGPSHNGNGADCTGSALCVDSAIGYKTPLQILINGGSFSSVAGYGIEEFSTAPDGIDEICYATITISGDVNAENCFKGAKYSQNHKIVG